MKYSADPGDVTQLLNAASRGDLEAAEPLMVAVYDDLKNIAQAHMRAESEGHTWQPTALVHEAYMRLVDQSRVEWNGRTHFLAVASRVMRRLLIDHARRKKTARRGGGRHITLLDQHAATQSDPLELLALDAALDKLAAVKERPARTVELRYFGGLEIKEVAEVLDVSEMTVKRDWNYAKAWLYREMTAGPAEETQ